MGHVGGERALCGPRLRRQNLTLLFEPLNIRDNPGYFLVGSAMGLLLVEEIGLPSVKLQYDIYHMQRGEGRIAATIERNLAQIGHIQITDDPSRHQRARQDKLPLPPRPPRPHRLRRLRRARYGPLGTTEESLGWIKDYELTL